MLLTEYRAQKTLLSSSEEETDIYDEDVLPPTPPAFKLVTAFKSASQKKSSSGARSHRGTQKVSTGSPGTLKYLKCNYEIQDRQLSSNAWICRNGRITFVCFTLFPKFSR